MQLKNIVFDLDGTLIDSSEGVAEAVNYSLTKMGLPTKPLEEITPFIGYPLQEMYQHFTDVPYDQLHHHFQVKAAETVVASTRPLPGVDAVLKQLHEEGYRLAIGTTKIRRHVDAIIQKCGWTELIAASVGGDEVPNVKPAPDCFREALTRLDVQPSESIVVGDTINDVLAAQAVPVKIAAVRSPYGGTVKMLEAQPDYFLESITQVPAFLRSINNKMKEAE